MSDQNDTLREPCRRSFSPPDSIRKRGQQAIAGLVDDPEAAAGERQRQREDATAEQGKLRQRRSAGIGRRVWRQLA